MNRNRQVLRLFLASPSDVTAERDAVEKVVGSINRDVASKLGILIELVRWEDVIPTMGRPEQVILDQADIEESDIFVGVLWNRFGTPTGKAESGTEEEFYAAYTEWQKRGKPRIMFYFCQKPANFYSEEEIGQKSKVIKFRQHLSKLGIFREYETIDAFDAYLRQDIISHLFIIAKSPQNTYPPLQTHLPLRSSGVQKEVNVPKDMVLVPRGEFLAGRVASSATIDYDFYIDCFPVTNSQFVEFMNTTGYMLSSKDAGIMYLLESLSRRAKKYPDHPITMVTWFDAVAYAAWLGKRLPTDLEWEKAARGTDGRLFPWGNDFDPSLCNSAESSIGDTTPVHKHKAGASPYGCLDIAGNVFEWTLDWTNSPQRSTAPSSEKNNRGGSYARRASDLVCWYIESDPPSLRMSDVGFRCVYSPDT